MFAEKELSCLWVLLSLDVIELDFHLVVLRIFILSSWRHVAYPSYSRMINWIGID
jgi:hypothetical protein